MKVEEKKENATGFISNEFTWASYTSLQMFDNNVRIMLSVIELEGIMLRKVENGEIKHEMSKEQLLRIKHFILLDMLAKMMMVIEGLIVMCSVLSGYGATKKHLSNRMIRYQQNQIDSFIKRFQEGRVSIWRIAGFPELRNLQRNCKLTNDERKSIWNLLSDSCLVLKETLNSIVTFYQNNKVLYGKFKHGLTIIPGLESIPGQDDMPFSLLLALDHRLEEPSSTCLKATGLLPPEFSWFNTWSILPYGEGTFKKYGAIISDLRKFVSHIVNNHLLWAENCGEDYFPLERQLDGRWVPTVYTKSVTYEKSNEVHAAIGKIVANTYVIDRILNFDLNIKDKALKRILECLHRDQVATIFRG